MSDTAGRNRPETHSVDRASLSEVSDDPRLFPIVKEYLERLEAGENPNVEDYVLNHPAISEALRNCLDGLNLIYRAATIDPQSLHEGRSAAPQHEHLRAPLGDFRVVRELGRGGMGIVYEAVQLSLGRRVALKVLPFAATLQPKQLQRFLNEAQAAAQLHHANIVPVFAVGCDRGVHYYAMQLIEGMSLAELLSKLRRDAGIRSDDEIASSAVSYPPSFAARSQSSEEISPRSASASATYNDLSARMSTMKSRSANDYYKTAARWTRQAAEALAYAHDIGIVHRDIKPANLMIDARGTVWVTDFGLAQFRNQGDLTAAGDLVGTLRYMSPEQSLGNRSLLDHRTDVYSLGATLYEMLTLRPIFPGSNKEQLLQDVAMGEPRAPRSLNRQIPIELETVVLKAVSKAPQDRYSSVQAMADDLQRFLEDKPILARRPTAADHVRKWSRRHPGVIASGVLLSLVVTASSLISNRAISRQQALTTAALAREQQRAGEAEQRFQQARQAVDVLIQVSEEELANKPMTDGTRQRLLAAALVYYQDFIEQKVDDDAGQAELRAVEERVRGILHELSILRDERRIDLLAIAEVQQDMRLSPERIDQVEAFVRQWSQERSRIFESGGMLESHARRHEFVVAIEKRERLLAEILTPEERTRLSQIALQGRGLLAFQEPEVVTALELTPGQQSQIRHLELKGYGRMHRAMRSDQGLHRRAPFSSREKGVHPDFQPRFKPDDMRRDFDAFQRESVQNALALLSTDQLDRWKRLTGKPFTAILSFGPPGPFGGPPREFEGPGPNLGGHCPVPILGDDDVDPTSAPNSQGSP